MNSKEAKETILKNGDSFKNLPAAAARDLKVAEAKGYLAALEGPEVRLLVEVIEPLCLALHEHLGFRYYPNGVQNFLDLIKKSEDALSQFREATETKEENTREQELKNIRNQQIDNVRFFSRQLIKTKEEKKGICHPESEICRKIEEKKQGENMTQYTVEQIKELLSKVTPGKWHFENDPMGAIKPTNDKGDLRDENRNCVAAWIEKKDAEFIAQSKEIIQWLLEKVEATRNDLRHEMVGTEKLESKLKIAEETLIFISKWRPNAIKLEDMRKKVEDALAKIQERQV